MKNILENHIALFNASTDIQNKLQMLSDAINSNDKKLMISLSKEISNLSNGLSKSIKEETGRLGETIAESGVVASAKLNKEITKIIEANKKNSNTKILKELTNSTSSLNAALEAISSQNKLLVKEIKDQKENITFP
ncbi:MAG: hypothetical protein VX976_01530 [Pseudomonadota bacterium]|nr:hypothetical protein [Pseudomonadota bacterium]